jgi:DNA (cytosine-5)-methyltransferase 1
MNCGHLFNGIGGFALAAHWMGWNNVMHCEIDPFCNKVMNKHFPNSYQHEDIRTTDFTIWRGRIDLLTGGFPCQPYSEAGKRKGKDDERHLWPEMLRAIREIRPGWIVGENVRGLTNWNGGLVFDEVQADLEAEGYEVLPFLLPAAGVNAPHRRDRIWFVANSNSLRFCKQEKISEQQRGTEVIPTGKNRKTGNRKELGFELPGNWDRFPVQPPFCHGDNGLSSRLDRISFCDFYHESMKAAGNAIVPQVAFQIFKAIEQWQLNQK